MSITELIQYARFIISKILHPNIIHLNNQNNSKKFVLLSYITNPFRMSPNNSRFNHHSNKWECRKMANIWLKHGYNVDVIDWNNTHFIPKRNYAIFIDIHANMERLTPFLKNSKKILHITGAHWKFQNTAETKRLSDLKSRRGFSLKPRRQVTPCNGIEYADCATILGNKFTQDTYAFSKKVLYPIHLSTSLLFPHYEKDFTKINKNYLWLGSTGMVHKGLDLVLEAFSQLPDYNLIVCGPVDMEKDFENAYFKELYQSSNIKTLGFVSLDSKDFLDTIQNTVGLIYPSCSEGQAGSVISCMHAGLIPIISYESGVDTGDFGCTLSENTIDAIIEAVISLSQKPTEELRIMSYKSWSYAREYHTREMFSKDYEDFVEKILNKTESF
ncbi:MAG: glycosyltransferase [Methanocorpusculum sp.]|uniref:glycosyltransferase n=1 Tax=Methanocorpusculum sp. TaxID=2058474 RepID=UPI002717A355|nr:glycosyltransferase [Methanocorpusculum sp.]MDO9523366.1 glycosyltransferase [Methanocorpusculum sp.]